MNYKQIGFHKYTMRIGNEKEIEGYAFIYWPENYHTMTELFGACLQQFEQLKKILENTGKTRFKPFKHLTKQLKQRLNPEQLSGPLTGIRPIIETIEGLEKIIEDIVEKNSFQLNNSNVCALGVEPPTTNIQPLSFKIVYKIWNQENNGYIAICARPIKEKQTSKPEIYVFGEKGIETIEEAITSMKIVEKEQLLPGHSEVLEKITEQIKKEKLTLTTIKELFKKRETTQIINQETTTPSMCVI